MTGWMAGSLDPRVTRHGSCVTKCRSESTKHAITAFDSIPSEGYLSGDGGVLISSGERKNDDANATGGDGAYGIGGDDGDGGVRRIFQPGAAESGAGGGDDGGHAGGGRRGDPRGGSGVVEGGGR